MARKRTRQKKATLADLDPRSLAFWAKTPWLAVFPIEVFVDFDKQLAREHRAWVKQLKGAFSE